MPLTLTLTLSLTQTLTLILTLYRVNSLNSAFAETNNGPVEAAVLYK